MKAIVLAAGYATRMYPLTLNAPKALLPVHGRPIIDYLIDQINTIPAVDAIWVVSNHKYYPFFADWAEKVPSAIPVKVLNDGTTSEEDRLGAIGDIFFALKSQGIEDEILVSVADNYFSYSLRNYYDFYRAKGHDAICAARIEDRESLKRFAVAVLDEENKVLSLVEKPENPPSDVAVYGTYFYQKETVPLIEQYLKEGNKPDAPGYFVQWLYKHRDVYAYIMDGECYDIGTVAAYEALNKEIFL